MSQSPLESEAASRDYIDGWQTVYRLVREGRSLSGYERNCCFLNTGGKRFADASAVAGLDQDLDGRALAVVDWDQDGDLDLWLTNRNAPRLTYLENRGVGGTHFVALRLVGTRSNRDAIGARVELFLVGDASGRRRVDSVRAGEGFLSQSSRWVHFGLGEASEVERVVVRWPSGESEEFRGLQADHHYRLVQGSGASEVLETPPAVALEPVELVLPPPTGVARIALADRFPLRGLAHEEASGVKHLLEGDGRPMLISLWASWCAPCLAELTGWAQRSPELQQAGLRIVLLSTDAPEDRGAAQAFLRRIEWGFESSYATDELLEHLQTVVDFVVDRPPRLALPASFLLDKNEQLVTIYHGSLEVDRLLADTHASVSSPEELRVFATAYAGQWLAPPRFHEPLNLVARMRARGLLDAAASLLGSMRLQPSISVPTAVREELAAAQHGMAEDFAKAGRYDDAITAYRLALETQPRRAPSLLRLGMALAATGQHDQAVKKYQETLEILPRDGVARLALGRAYVALGDSASAGREALLLQQLDPHSAATLREAIASMPTGE